MAAAASMASARLLSVGCALGMVPVGWAVTTAVTGTSKRASMVLVVSDPCRTGSSLVELAHYKTSKELKHVASVCPFKHA